MITTSTCTSPVEVHSRSEGSALGEPACNVQAPGLLLLAVLCLKLTIVVLIASHGARQPQSRRWGGA